MFPENAGINIIPSLLYRDVRGCYRGYRLLQGYYIGMLAVPHRRGHVDERCAGAVSSWPGESFLGF